MPKKLSNSFKVKRPNGTITVGPYTYAGSVRKVWRFGYQPVQGPGMPWKYVTCGTKDEAKVAAEKVLDERAAGMVWLALSPERRRFHEAIERECKAGDEDAVLAFIASRSASSALASAVSDYLAFKVKEAGEETPYLARVRTVLEGLVAAFPGRSVADIHKPDLAAWWQSRCGKLGEKRQKDVRAVLVAFWNWAQLEGIAGAERISPAKRLPVPKVILKDPRIPTLDEFKQLCREIDEEDRAAVVLGAFAGLRPEEAAPPRKAKSKKKGKRGLIGEDLDWRFKVIRVPAAVSKVDTPRNIPMSEALIAWLAWAGIREGFTGPLCPRNLVESGTTKRMGKIVFGGAWPKDILRHAYGSNRNAIVRNLQQVAEEMGTSVKMMHGHYHNPRAEEEGVTWFAQRPGCLKPSEKNAILEDSARITEAANA